MIKYVKLIFWILFFICFNILKVVAQKTGYACIYSKSLCGGPTASGEKMNCTSLTAAHLNLKMGTRVKLTHLKNKKSVIVRINDRGPYTKRFMIDLSPAAAKALGFGYTEGVAKVKMEIMK